jgi:HlyD family secretion protein
MTRPFFSATRHGIPLLAVAMVGFAGWSIASKYRPREAAAPLIAASTHSYENDVAGSGIVEPASEVIALAIERGGVVTRVDVVAGELVKPGQPLFSIDARNYEAAVAQDEAAVAAENAAIASIEQSIILQQDAIDQAGANLDSAEAERTRASLDHARYAVLVRGASATRQRFESATADAEKASATVAAEKASLASARQQNEVLAAQRREAEAKLDQAKAALEGARADLDKTVVKAPIDGAILKVNARLGEYAQAGVLSNPLMTMGSIEPLHVRVDIDEADSWRLHTDSPAVASLRGNPAISVALSFVRFEPYVLPKRSLTGDTAERVDTRVLQAIYAFAPSDFPAFVGQQVDVFIKAPARAEATRNPASGRIFFGAFADSETRAVSRAN